MRTSRRELISIYAARLRRSTYAVRCAWIEPFGECVAAITMGRGKRVRPAKAGPTTKQVTFIYRIDLGSGVSASHGWGRMGSFSLVINLISDWWPAMPRFRACNPTAVLACAAAINLRISSHPLVSPAIQNPVSPNRQGCSCCAIKAQLARAHHRSPGIRSCPL